jgi:hypothetical protein
MSYTYVLQGLLLGEYSLKVFKNIFKLKKISLYYYVKVYLKDFKIYVIFKSFEVYL